MAPRNSAVDSNARKGYRYRGINSAVDSVGTWAGGGGEGNSVFVYDSSGKVTGGNVSGRSLFRRRLSAEAAKPESNNRLKMGSGYVCMYVYMFVRLVFANIWRFKTANESKAVPYDSHVNSTLLKHEIIGM